MSSTLDDVSLRDFEPPLSPDSLRNHSLPPLSDVESTTSSSDDGHPARTTAAAAQDSEIVSAGGYSPPAWRRLGNGDRSNGFWRGPSEPPPGLPFQYGSRTSFPWGSYAREREEEDEELEQAIRTRLPKGSQSPERTRHSTPERIEDETLRVRQMSSAPELEPPNDNYFRFAVRAEVQQRTAIIEATLSFFRHYYHRLTATWSSLTVSILVALFSISLLKTLFQPAMPRPAGDLVKIAGVARSFEPLIYYSEHAILQVQDLQATSIAVWDLGESVRSSEMKDATSIVDDLDGLSENMKTLAEEMTRFLSRVDGDIDAILNVMDWAKMHLNRFQTTVHTSTLSSAYDNVHNALSSAHILEDAAGQPTPIGSVTSFIFGPSNPQREQRIVQSVFREFLSVLEESISSELQHSLTLFALFEAVDRHMLNLGRTVVRESSAQAELHADLLSGLWARILGPRASDVRKYETNRLLLKDVREKTVRNRGILEEHNTKLLGLKASLEGLRSKLVSPLVRGANATTLSLEDQIRGISDVSGHLGDVRRIQKGRVMESMFASNAGRRFVAEQAWQPIGEGK